MNEMDYKEYLVKRKKGVKEILLSALIYLTALALSVATMMFVNVGGMELLVAVGFLFGGYKLASSFNREFEYTVTEDCVDIDTIFNASSRKKIVSFRMKEVEIIAPVDSDKYKEYSGGDYKIIDASTHKNESSVYFAIVEKNGVKHLVKFDLPVAALSHLRKYAPSKVVIG